MSLLQYFIIKLNSGLRHSNAIKSKVGFRRPFDATEKVKLKIVRDLVYSDRGIYRRQ